jgi:polyhydroxyalkanoate synthesis regulator phasin
MTTLPPNYIGEFLKENESNLLKIERENPELYKVVGDLLSYLNKNYGDGKSVKEEAIENVEEVKEQIQSIENQPSNLIPIDFIEIVYNEGTIDVSGKYSTWDGLTNALKEVHEAWRDNGGLGYNKVKIKVQFSDGMTLLERVDIGDSDNGDFDPNLKNVADYLVEAGYVDISLLQKYAFSDFSGKPEVVKEAVKDAKDELQAEINELEEILKFVQDKKEKQEITEEIEALKISLNSL